MKRYLVLLLLPLFTTCLSDSKLARLCSERFPSSDSKKETSDSTLRILPTILLDSFIFTEILRTVETGDSKKDSIIIDSLKKYKYIIKTVTRIIYTQDSAKIYTYQETLRQEKRNSLALLRQISSEKEQRVIVEGKRNFWRNSSLSLLALLLSALCGFIMRGGFTLKNLMR